MRYFIYCRKSSEAEDRQVMSLESQLSSLQRAFAERLDIVVVDIYHEAFSAKAPGRSNFNQMLERIEKGEAEGIVAWAPDRLARNSIDGGRIIYLLDRGVLRDLKFATYTFENNSQGKFMLQIMFGQSKYYSDALSENVKRGNRTKIEKGWRPNQAPLGYLNDKTTKTIVQAPDHFPIVRQIFDAMLTGSRSIEDITCIANNVWGYRTPKKKRIGGGPLGRSTIYHMLTNPFYAGYILWGGQLYPGKHDPVVSIAEFERVQELLGRPTRPKPQRHEFAYTGMIRCGACNRMITAENKVNRYGTHYLYYHCTKKQHPKCRQPSVQVKVLEGQIRDFLTTVTLPDCIHQWALRQIAASAASREGTRETQIELLQRSIRDTGSQISTLTDLRIRGLITDAEFSEKRARLQKAIYRLEQSLQTATTTKNPIEPEQLLLLFSNRAISWFDGGDIGTRRMILQILGSNLSLTDKKVNIQAKKPFRSIAKIATKTSQLAGLDDVRTFPANTNMFRELRSVVRSTCADSSLQSVLDDIRALMRKFRESLPPLPVPVLATPSRRGKASHRA